MEGKTLAVFFATLAFLQGVDMNSCVYPPCGDVPNRLHYYYPNWNNCSTYWRCYGKRASLEACPDSQEFDLLTFRCVSMPSREQLALVPVLTCSIYLKGVDHLSPALS